MHHTLPELRAIDARFPAHRKLLLVPSINFGRELLASLAHAQGGWIGWEVATLATVAEKLSMVAMARAGLRRASDVAVSNLVSTAFNRAVADGAVADVLATLAWSTGTREAVTDAVLELRAANVSALHLQALGNAGVASSLAAVLHRYQLLLDEGKLADAAQIFRLAIDDFAPEAPFVLDHAVLVCTPGWTVRGEPRRLFELLVGHGLRSLGAPNVGVVAPAGLVQHLAAPLDDVVFIHGSAADTLHQVPHVTADHQMFCAGSAADELREVLRRVVASGAAFDDVEIAATDVDTYGDTINALCEHLGVNCTSLEGVRLERTRIGRALNRWLDWLESDYTVEHIRGALESGDWTPTPAGRAAGDTTTTAELQAASAAASAALQLASASTRAPEDVTALSAGVAAELRGLQIGWGLEQTRRAITQLRDPDALARLTPHDDESADDFSARCDARKWHMHTLANLLAVLVANAAQLPASGGSASSGQQISVATLAADTARVLTLLVTPRSPADGATLTRLLERLADIAAVADDQVAPAYALATLRHEIANLRAWTDASATTRPRRATGGHLHFTNIESAGATGRPQLFIVGLDADRTAGPVTQSPLLPDWLRNRLNDAGATLTTNAERRRTRAWQLATALSASDAQRTMSYALRSGADARETGPSSVLLHGLPAKEGGNAGGSSGGNAGANTADEEGDTAASSMSYEQLRTSLGSPAGPIPSTVARSLDARDVWLAHMSDQALLLDAEAVARAVYPGLDRGLAAQTARDADETGGYHGIVPAAGKLDPRTSQRPISPSSLERIAHCSLRWFYASALHARPPEEPEFNALVWLNARDRGSALHTIYEQIVRERLYEQAPSDSRRHAMRRIVQQVISECERRIPVPSAAVLARESQALMNDAALFVSGEHDAFQREPWDVVALESTFGGDAPAQLSLPDGTSLLVHGRVDRVDRLRDGTLRLVDYKTGRAFDLASKRGLFDGGRKLQLAVYSPAISAQLSAMVSVAEYRFPTERGEGEVARTQEGDIKAAPAIVQSLLDDVAAGRFVPTIDKEDCAFCEFAVICRTTRTRFSSESPRAAWAAAHAEGNPHYVGVTRRRQGADES